MAGRRPGPDLASLTALAILTRAPRHAYDLHRYIVDTHKDYVTGLPRSLYHAITRLADTALITAVATTRTGQRPERTVYAITEQGRAELADRLRHLLTTLTRDTTGFVAALSLLGALPPDEASQALTDRADQLRRKLDTTDRTLTDLAANGVPRLALLKLEYERSRHAAELDWIDHIAAELADGRITWDVPPPSLGRTP